MAAVKRQGPESARRRPDKLSPEEIFDNIDDLTDRSWFILSTIDLVAFMDI
jgi:hypothetical protein